MASDPDPKDKPGADLVSQRAHPYPTHRLAPRIDLVDMAAEIEKADHTLGMVVGAKLDVIRDQIRALQEQARRLLEDATASAKLHRARCAFHKVPGHVYHLYRHDDGSLYFSMLSPQDWNGSPPHTFQGSYRLEIDMSWTAADTEREQPDGRALVAQLLEGNRK